MPHSTSYEGEGLAELACLAVHPDYRNAGRGNELLQNVEREARAAGLCKLFVLTPKPPTGSSSAA
ncbi:MAG: GNAT family N-acetyltransferase [Gammaproteobacteria bacterium]